MNFDVAIVGSGLAGLSVALNLAETRRVAVIAKRSMTEGASDWAQGGIAAVLDSADSIENHVRDTLIAGGGLCDEAATRFIVEHGRAAIEWLIEQGVPFTKDDAAELGFHLTREGGHSHRRIIHAADATGHAVVTTLSERVRRHPNITLLEDHYAIDLITSDRLGLPGRRCHGLYALDIAQRPHRDDRGAAHGPRDRRRGQGLSVHDESRYGDRRRHRDGMARRLPRVEHGVHPVPPDLPVPPVRQVLPDLRSGARRRRHPETARRHALHAAPRRARRTRAARHRRARDRLRNQEARHRLRVSRHQPSAGRRSCEEHFPTILARCLEFGIDITKEPIPVVPAAHYTCGGVVTDLAGRTDLAGLYAVGETSCTGLHGANRLASNSLLECLVVGRAAAQAIEEDGLRRRCPRAVARLGRKPRVRSRRRSGGRAQLGRTAPADVELRRHRAYRQAARARASIGIALLREEIHEYYANFKVSRDLLELRNLVDVASLIVESAARGAKAAGLHFSRDWPATLPKALPSVLSPEYVRNRNV